MQKTLVVIMSVAGVLKGCEDIASAPSQRRAPTKASVQLMLKWMPSQFSVTGKRGLVGQPTSTLPLDRQSGLKGLPAPFCTQLNARLRFHPHSIRALGARHAIDERSNGQTSPSGG